MPQGVRVAPKKRCSRSSLSPRREMAKRASSSRTAVRMSIAFMNNATGSGESQVPDNIADDCTTVGAGFAGDEGGPYVRQCSTKGGDNLRLRRAGADGASSSAAARKTAARLVAGAFQLESQQPASPAETDLRARLNEAGPQHPAPAPTDVLDAGLPVPWEETHQDVQSQHGSLLVRHHSPTKRWVRFAWEPLATGGQLNRGSSCSPIVTETHTSVPGSDGGGRGGSSTNGTSNAIPLSELLEVSAPQGHGRLRAKRFRASPGQERNSLGDECDADATRTDEWHSSFLMGQSLPDWRERGRPSPESSDRASSTQSKNSEPAIGDANGQANGAHTPVELGGVSPKTSKEVVDVAAAAGSSSSGATGHSSSLANGGNQMRGCAPGGTMPRFRTWGDALATTTTAREGTAMVPTRAGGYLALAAAAVAEHQPQEQEKSSELYGVHVGGSTKKARYRSVRVPHTLSVGHMDSLTRGVSSLGVASPGGARGGEGSEPKPVHASTSENYALRRQTPTSSARTVCLPERVSSQTPIPRGEGGGCTIRGLGAGACAGPSPSADTGACAGAGASVFPGTRGKSPRPVRSRGEKACAAIEDPRRYPGRQVYHNSKKRQRDDHLPLGAPAFRSTHHIVEKDAPVFDAAVSIASSPSTTATAMGGVCGDEEGKGVEVTAIAEGSTGAEDDGNSSDGGAAYEELSVWLHGTDDWWTS